MPISLNDYTYSTFLSLDFGQSTGSGFRITVSEKEYLITAKHVVFKEIYDAVGNKTGEEPREDILITSQNYDSHRAYAYSSKVNLLKSKIETFSEKDIVAIYLENNVNYEIYDTGNAINTLSIHDLEKLENIQMATNIYMVGFPSSLINSEDYDTDRPLLRSGIVAGINHSKDTFIIDSAAFYGNSGGIILQKTEYGIKGIGIVSRYIPFLTEWYNLREKQYTRQEFYNSGYAICQPLDPLIDYFNTKFSDEHYDN